VKAVQYTVEDDGAITFTVKACPNDLQYVPELRRWGLDVLRVMVGVVADEIKLRGAYDL
jgi:hypothetical protein